MADTATATMTVSKGYRERWERLATCMRKMCEHTSRLSQCLANTGHEVPDCFKTVIGWTNHRINNTLVVSVHGGVNTGKSTTFNILCDGEVSPADGVPTTRHPLAAAPQELDPPDLALGELLPGNHRLVRTDDPAAVCDPDGQEAIYVVEHESILGPSLVIDCPDYNSTELENRRRAREVARASDLVLLVLSGESAYEAATAEFFADVHESQKIIVPVAGGQKGESRPLELINGFRETLRQQRGITWEPQFAIAVGNLTRDQLDDPSASYCKDIRGFEGLDLSDDEDRARAKFSVWKNTCLSATQRTEESLGLIEQKAAEWAQAEENADAEVERAAERLLDILFPMGGLMQVVEDELLRNMNFVSRTLYKCNPARLLPEFAQKTWGLTSRQIKELLKKWRMRKEDGEDKANGEVSDEMQEIAEAADEQFRAQTGSIVEEALRRIDEATEALADDQLPTSVTKKRVGSVVEDVQSFQQNVVAGSAFSACYERHIRQMTDEWWAGIGRMKRWGIESGLCVLPLAIGGSVAVAAAIPGIGMAEGVLGAVLAPQIVASVKANLSFITPLKDEWIEEERDKLLDYLRDSLCGDFSRRAAHWRDVDAILPNVRKAATEAQQELEAG
jgi:hypothetical protein